MPWRPATMSSSTLRRYSTSSTSQGYVPRNGSSRQAGEATGRLGGHRVRHPVVSATEFAGACVNASADRAVLEGSLAMAWTAIDLATGPLRARLGGG